LKAIEAVQNDKENRAWMADTPKVSTIKPPHPIL
jgi:hypothetical protein